MFGNRFYHQTTRRYVALFGTLFNDIQISRKDNSGQTIQTMKVPIHYAPMEKILARIEQDPGLNNPTAMTLPRMSFEITNMSFAPERKLTSLTKNNKVIQNDGNTKISQFVPAPYDLEFQLNVMTKHTEDGLKIIEQIMPFFKPEFTASVKLVDEMDMYFDVPVILSGITMSDEYEGDFTQRRVLNWTLNFTVKAYYFGPVSNKKVIKFVETNTYEDLPFIGQPELQTHTSQPGVSVNSGQFEVGKSYRILDLGTGTTQQWTTVGWEANRQAPTSSPDNYELPDKGTGATPKQGDVFTATTTGSEVTGGVATLTYDYWDEDDSWRSIVIIDEE